MSTLDTLSSSEQTTRTAYPVDRRACVTAAAISSVLLAFASAAGFLLFDGATWRDASFALWLLAGVLACYRAVDFGAGGYVAGGCARAW
jgi:hypothetical protein